MNPDYSTYRSPLETRYSSKEMSFLFSAKFKFSTWRKLWLSLAKAEQKLGLPITDGQLLEMEQKIECIDFSRASFHEKILKHDVMAHLHTFAEACQTAKPIMHLGATSAYLTDNTELIQINEALKLLKAKLSQVIRQLAKFCEKTASIACLGFTHFQPAQPTTVGKRASLWLQDFMIDLEELLHRQAHLSFLGTKGATGTQASFLSLFDGDEEKVKELDSLIAKDMGFSKVIPLSGQTYTRKQDIHILDLLSQLAASSHKFATDLRLLSHLKEMEEPFEESQVGSSAMPYKRNPVLSERICSLARFVFSLSENPRYTMATQWLERTLDDSANRRLILAEAFLACDGICNLLIYITKGIQIYPKVIEKKLLEELPFLATEHFLMAAVKKGYDRQKIHEILRIHSKEAADSIKQTGGMNDLLFRLGKDPNFPFSKEELEGELKEKHFIGRAEAQVKDYLAEEVFPMLQKLEITNVPVTPLEV